MEYVIFVAYGSDAERKRIEYLLEKWGERAKVRKPRGVVFLIDTEEPQEFLEELFSKLEGDVNEKVEVYEARRIKGGINTRKRTLEFTVKEEKRIMDRFIDYLLSKLNASYIYSDALAKVYTVYTRKGRATLKVIVKGNGKSTVVFEIEGYGEVVDFLAEKISEELKLFAGD